MIAVTFNIRLLQPLLVTQPGSDDETGARSSDHIPGSVLRNALAAHYIKTRRVADPAVDPECRRLFFDETTRFLSALPAPTEGQLTWPTPLSWYIKKSEQAEFSAGNCSSVSVHDAAVDPDIFNDSSDDLRPFARDGRFCQLDAPDSDTAHLVDVAREVAIHIQRENRRLLYTKTDTQVYTYHTLSAGQQFAGAIVVPDQTTADQLAGLLSDFEISIGGSRSAGYGRVRFHNVACQPWSGYAWPAEEEETIITLLSDTIVRDPLTGQCCQNLTPLFGPPLRAYADMRLVGGFNRKWALPTPQAYAIRAGSVFVYPRAAIPPDVLERAAREGIGERRCDGFGHIAVNWQRHSKVTVERPAKSSVSSLQFISTLEDPEAVQVAQMIVNYALRQHLDQQVVQAVIKYASSVRGGATRSALSRVRLEARQAGFGKSDLAGLRRLLNDMKTGDKLKPAAKSLNEIRIGDERLYDYLCELVKEPVNGDTLIKLLGSRPKEADFAIAGVKPASLDSLAAEYVARFIEGLMNQLIKREKRRQEEGS
ncbi:MAG: hypothetical protein ACUVSX_11345 [Aggregatilineales bacterium]